MNSTALPPPKSKSSKLTRKRNMKSIPRIESDTPIVPSAIARAVWEEASLWLDELLPRSWIRELVARANTVYAHNARFRRIIRGLGDRGRDSLWAFTRHWLAGLLWEHRRHLHARLPASYNVGQPLPQNQPHSNAKSPSRTRKPTRWPIPSTAPSAAKLNGQRAWHEMADRENCVGRSWM